MEQVSRYLLSVIAVCMIGVLCLQLVKLPRVKAVVRFVSGLLVLLVAASALVTLDENQLEKIAEELQLNLEVNQEDLEEEVRSNLATHVKNTAENYIEQYAAELGVVIQARVTVSDEEYPVPYAVTVIGMVSPQQKTALEQYLNRSLNIPYERQEWK